MCPNLLSRWKWHCWEKKVITGRKKSLLGEKSNCWEKNGLCSQWPNSTRKLIKITPIYSCKITLIFQKTTNAMLANIVALFFFLFLRSLFTTYFSPILGTKKLIRVGWGKNFMPKTTIMFNLIRVYSPLVDGSKIKY